MTVVAILRRAALFLILTVLTQVGGVLYLLYQLIRWQISQRVPGKWRSCGYSLLSLFVPQNRTPEFSTAFNRRILLLFSRHPDIDKIFLEPHLKSRLRLSSYGKIRFHGCAAVRHDDHIHIQL